MQVKNLTTTNFQTLTNCFNEAFANYFVPINATPDYLKQRWKGARIDSELSFGVFDKERLVAFMFIGIDQHHGKLTAHNDGTGVIPTYRGNRLVDKMYEVAIPKFKAHGIKQCSLEVIQENTRAIKVYERIGFKKLRGVNCYGGEIIQQNQPIPNSITIRKNDSPNWTFYETFFDFVPCWNNSLNWVKAIQNSYEIFEIFEQQKLVGFAAVDSTGSLPIFGIHPAFRQKGYGLLLLEHIAQSRPKLRANNVEDTATATINFLEKMGMQNSINQFEMLLPLD